MAHKNKTNISPYKTRQSARQKDGKSAPPPPLKGRHHKPDVIYSLNEANDRLYDIFKNHGFSDFPHEKRLQLAQFYRLLMQQQEKENFTRLLKFRDIAVKHFIDCLMVPRLVDLKFPLIDVGTGPGFPGVPLKIQFPKEKIILAEGVQKRVEFLKHVREDMRLENLPIIGRNINPFFAYPVQGVITRAVEDVRNTLTNTLTALQTGGCVYFMKGPNVDPEIAVAEKEVGEFFELEKDIAYELPNTDQKRRLLVYRKVKMGPLVDFDEEPWPEDD